MSKIYVYHGVGDPLNNVRVETDDEAFKWFNRPFDMEGITKTLKVCEESGHKIIFQIPRNIEDKRMCKVVERWF